MLLHHLLEIQPKAILQRLRVPMMLGFTCTYSGLNVLSGEVAKVRFLKQLFSIQCELEPIAACKVIPIMEATRLGRAYDSGLAIFNERVTI